MPPLQNMFPCFYYQYVDFTYLNISYIGAVYISQLCFPPCESQQFNFSSSFCLIPLITDILKRLRMFRNERLAEIIFGKELFDIIIRKERFQDTLERRFGG